MTQMKVANATCTQKSGLDTLCRIITPPAIIPVKPPAKAIANRARSTDPVQPYHGRCLVHPHGCQAQDEKRHEVA